MAQFSIEINVNNVYNTYLADAYYSQIMLIIKKTNSITLYEVLMSMFCSWRFDGFTCF